jgi:hypothetical protein
VRERDNISDETPIADAVEQEQEQETPDAARRGPASLHQENGSVEPPMDADTPDWQEQWQEVADADSDDRDEYRESQLHRSGGPRPATGRRARPRVRSLLNCPRTRATQRASHCRPLRRLATQLAGR